MVKENKEKACQKETKRKYIIKRNIEIDNF